MRKKIKNISYKLLRKTEKYTKTDMVYLAKGGSWLTFGQIVSSASAFLLAIAFANLLPMETYGTYKFILSLSALLVIPTLVGMDTAVVRAVARGSEGTIIPAFKTKVRWGLLGGLASLALAGYYYFQEDTILTFSFLIAAIFIPFMDPAAIYESYLGGKKLFSFSAKYRSIIRIIATAVMITVLFLSDNIFYVILAYFIPYSLLRYIFLKIALKKFAPNKNIDPKAISYGKHLSLISVIGTITGNIDKILLWHFLGAIQLATYSFALSPVNQVKSAFKNLRPLSMPKLSQGSMAKLKITLPKKIFKLFLIILPIVILYIIFAPLLFRIFFSQYISSINYSRVFAFSLLLYPMTFFNYALTAQMKKRQLYIASTITNISQIILLLILLPLYGIWGAIFVLLATVFIRSIINFYLFKKL